MGTPGWLSSAECSVSDLADVTRTGTTIDGFPWAAQVLDDILVYSAAALRPTMADPAGRRGLQAEIARALSDGPGVVLFSGAFADTDLLNAVSAVFDDLVDESRVEPATDADRTVRQTDRVPNALEILADRDQGLFDLYTSNDVLALAAGAWLGPHYRLGSQLQVVNPGNPPERVHCDGELASLGASLAERYPAHVHALAPMLTLQGFVAHVDMPVESGPPMFLPHSQKYRAGSLALDRPEFGEYFAAKSVQLPLFTGDALFFNPAVFHAAGGNTTRTVRRMAILLEMASAFARPARPSDSVDLRAGCGQS